MSEDDVDAEIKVGDVAHDLSQDGSKVQVVARAADTVADHEGREAYDVSTWKSNQLLNISDDEPVWRCVYISGELTTSFSDTYDIPDSRLARIPVEKAADELRRTQYELTVKAFGTIFEAIAHVGEDGHEAAATVADYLIARGFPEEIVDEALELAQVDAVIGGGEDGE